MKTRIISAIVVLAILIPFICIGGIPFACAVSLIAILAYKEVIDLKKSHNAYPKVIMALGLISLLYIILGDYRYTTVNFIIGYAKILLPSVLILLPSIFYSKDKYSTKDAFFLLGMVYFLGLFFNLLIYVRAVNVYVLVYLLSITIFTDTFAYAIGSLIGKHKICKLSPKKSWEGAIAGLIGGSTVAIIVYSNLVDSFSFELLVVTILLSIVGQIGDLFFSKIKRENDIKDFSHLIPGHGGILDRLDSIIFVVITYAIIVWFI